MDEPRLPLTRIVGGSGTHADPYRIRNDLEHLLHRIYPAGNQTQALLAQARQLLARTDMSDETRAGYEQRLDDLDYQWHLHRTADLVRWAYRQFAPLHHAERRREELLQQAHAAREAFYEFAARHPAIHECWNGEVPPVEELMAKYQAE